MKQHTLYELNEFLRRIVAANLPDSLWLTCEIMQISTAKGHFYLDLIEKDDVTKQIIAQAQAVLWNNTYRSIKRKIGENLNLILRDGIRLLIKVRVDFNERYGLKFVIEDIDPAYTFGQLALQKQAILQQLEAENLVTKNRQHTLPAVPQRIAVISSQNAAGLQDFLAHLHKNPYGYRFETTLFEAAVQGQFLEKEVGQALLAVAAQAERFDVAVVLRGGGSKLDLAGFDNLKLCRLVAAMPLPILTGIGHEVDETLLDMVAHTSLKTPTAVADFLVEQLFRFENTLQTMKQQVENSARKVLIINQLAIQAVEKTMAFQAQKQIEQQNRMLDYIEQQLPKMVKNQLRQADQQLNFLEKNLRLLSPEYALQRGFSITLVNGKAVQNAASVQSGDVVKTILKDGAFESVVAN